jgi:ubiquinone/menaquinone biosynthesis C-methylase UbiE
MQAGAYLIGVAEGYERWAATYDRVPNPLLAREERYLLPVLGSLNGKRVLDVACGTGRWLGLLIQGGAASGVGIDCSPAMLRVARAKRGLSNRLVEATGDTLPFPGSSFDLAVCSFAIGHFQNLVSLVRELARVSKPGADVFVSDLHPDAYARGWRVGFRDEHSTFRVEMLARTPEEVTQTFAANCFERLKLESLCLGSPEEPFFERAGKAEEFAKACQLPAILVCHFRRKSESPQRRYSSVNDSVALPTGSQP